MGEISGKWQKSNFGLEHQSDLFNFLFDNNRCRFLLPRFHKIVSDLPPPVDAVMTHVGERVSTLAIVKLLGLILLRGLLLLLLVNQLVQGYGGGVLTG